MKPRVVVAAVALLGSLVLVAWRQARAMEALADLHETRTERTLMAAQRTELERRIQALESRSHVLPEARRRLRMRIPEASEIVILAGEGA